eukprot:11100669-Heterocapsa_arctica.AAC.1
MVRCAFMLGDFNDCAREFGADGTDRLPVSGHAGWLIQGDEEAAPGAVVDALSPPLFHKGIDFREFGIAVPV